MDHESTREQLELAALEPGGLERLMAGDTPAAQAVAAHLAGCPACTDELARLERTARLARQVVRELPPAGLKERTLAAVRAAGTPRSDAAARDAGDVRSAGDLRAAGAGASSVTTAVPIAAPGAGRRAALGWVAAIAAAVLVSVAATSAIVGGRVDAQLAEQAATIDALQHVTIATLQVGAAADSRRVSLAGTEPGLSGELVFSPSTTELVVIATGLAEPPADQEYRCWVNRSGDRERVGKMFFGDGVAYWVGPVQAVADLDGPATFGVTLVSLDGSTDSVDVLEGGL